jgi:ABC-type nitrate/sulfonate/bicarbonate transport system ATPase subunit
MDDVVLEFADIRQAFAAPGGGAPLTVLDGISFRVRRGEFVAVIGPSGCGKSTLLQMAAGLLAPTGGQVSQEGAPITGVNRRVGLVPQQAQLYPWKTLIQNVEFPLALRGVGAAERRARAAAAIAAVDLKGFENHWPYQLSGGMQKRASIARMLVYGPDVILMDEPFGALDAQTKMRMQNDLQDLAAKSGAAVLFVTHDITEAIMLADTVVVLSRRPTRLLASVPIALPRPRNVFEPFSVPGFTDAYDQVWQLFRGEVETGAGGNGRSVA